MKDNPYINSYKIEYPEGDMSLERYDVVFNPKLKDTIHTISLGETLQNIAFRYYKDSGAWYKIAEYNNIMDPFEELEPGMEILIP